jgi:ribokinase
VLPAARLGPGLALAPRRRAAVGRLQPRGGIDVDAEVDAALVQRPDLVGRDEPWPVADADHESVKDVLLGRGNDVVHGADLLATGCVNGHAALEHLIGDRQALVHDGHTTDMTHVSVVGHFEWVDFVSVPHLPVHGEILHADSAFARAGGGGAVAATVLAELGAEVDFYCALGQDADGEAAVAQLEDRGVRVHVAWRDQPTRRAVTFLEPGTERTIVTLGEWLEPRGSDELEWERLADAGSVYFTAGDAAALERAHAAPFVVASPRAREVLEADGAWVYALVFSEGDDDESAWAHRVASHARLLVATEGAQGGRWWGESEGRWSATPLPGPPHDTYGCGDSFAAAFTLGLGRDDSIAEAAKLGAKSGALALTRIGAP